MRKKTEKKRREAMGKAIYVKAPKEFVDMLNQSQWHLKMRPAQIVRKAVIEYLERHLPKEVKDKIFKEVAKKWRGNPRNNLPKVPKRAVLKNSI
jgi:hypothetical protein